MNVQPIPVALQVKHLKLLRRGSLKGWVGEPGQLLKANRARPVGIGGRQQNLSIEEHAVLSQTVASVKQTLLVVAHWIAFAIAQPGARTARGNIIVFKCFALLLTALARGPRTITVAWSAALHFEATDVRAHERSTLVVPRQHDRVDKAAVARSVLVDALLCLVRVAIRGQIFVDLIHGPANESVVVAAFAFTTNIGERAIQRNPEPLPFARNTVI
mmetsp:Transcript_59656/g.122360  ORF Transcript_59656/g.122360 Transcript_59656/m.122360 type:complete len:216 (-) Transcript_59656:536-1183(-)